MSGHGIVIGKFYPPHAGHHFLIDSALERCDRVSVLVLGSSVESIPLALRHAWMAERHPAARVLSAVDDHPIDYEDPKVYDLHDQVIRRLCPEPIDFVFSSEPYGEVLAQRYGAEHVMVDQARRRFEVSGTAVRDDPAANWRFLTPAVRAWLTKRVSVVGAESTGTTTMTIALAEQFRACWVPEYGRQYSVARTAQGAAAWRSEDFEAIAREQLAQEDATARRGGPVIFCDTDALATAIWHERYVGSRSEAVRALAASREYALYLLTDDDIPFVQDGTRDGEHHRAWMTGRFRDELAARAEPHVTLRGNHQQRFRDAASAVQGIIDAGWTFAPPLG